MQGHSAAYIPPDQAASTENLTGAVVYSSPSSFDGGHIHRYELTKSPLAWSDCDMTAWSGAPNGGTAPVGYVRSDGADENHYLLGTSIMQIAGFATSGVPSMGSFNMTQLFGLPAAASGPHPYRRPDGANAIVYRDTSGRIQELSFKPGVFGWTLT